MPRSSTTSSRPTSEAGQEPISAARLSNPLLLLWLLKGLMPASQPHHFQPRLQHLAHSIHPSPQRRVDEVGVALGGADLGVAKQPPDHFQ